MIGITVLLVLYLIPNSDQHQISPGVINAYSSLEVTRELRIRSPKVNFLDILILVLLSTIITKVWGGDRRIYYLMYVHYNNFI